MTRFLPDLQTALPTDNPAHCVLALPIHQRDKVELSEALGYFFLVTATGGNMVQRRCAVR